MAPFGKKSVLAIVKKKKNMVWPPCVQALYIYKWPEKIWPPLWNPKYGTDSILIFHFDGVLT